MQHSKTRLGRLLKQLTRAYSTVGPKVIFEKKTPQVRFVTLNVPKTLNSLDFDMINMIQNQYFIWQEDEEAQIVCFKGEGKAFCAGGDIMKLYSAKKQATEGKKPAIHDTFFRNEFTLDYSLATMRPTQVAIWDGFVMGGGVGLSIHAPVKIATENSVFAMPEAKIGFFTDVGGGYFLSKLPNHVGRYLALTSDVLKGEDLVKAGVATHYMPSENLQQFEQQLADEVNNDNSDEILNSLLEKYTTPVEGELANIEKISDLFGDNSMAAIIHHLRMDSSDFSKHCQKLLTKVSPLSLRVIFEQMKRANDLDLRQAFIQDFRIAQRFMQAEEFFEGVRCLLVDRGDEPQWKYERASMVPQHEIDEYFIPFKINMNGELKI